MSKAFTDEEATEAPPLLVPRAPLPQGVPNYVTARGLALLRDELAALQAERVPEGPERAPALALLAQRRAQLEERIASAELVTRPGDALEVVRFGAHVRVESAEGLRGYQIVGVDEADAARGRIAFVSPLARALLGRRVGDVVRVRVPRGEQELEVVAIGWE